MKQQIIELKKKLLLVELPEGAKIIKMEGKYRFGFKEKDLEADVYLGKLTDITEEQFAEWVKSLPNVMDYRYRDYKDYNTLSKGSITFYLKTAKESFFSKLEADGIYFGNKLGEFPNKYNTGLEYGMEYISKRESWEEKKEKVWRLDNCYVFEIL